ncbi:MAG TPA: helix-turn-helix transcriptional regulator [Thermoanaerobaculia bacterium]|nr:helix-turn-helix transcriptional regulator [Thermoanaerobaculia bacterium]
MLTLDNASITPVPRSIPEAGADVTVTFRFIFGATGFFSTRYTVLNVGYAFANANSEGAILISSRSAPSVSGFSDLLRVRATGNARNQGTVVIRIEVQESLQHSQTGSIVLFILHSAVSAFRAANQLSQAAFAQQIGVAPSTISRIERGLTPSSGIRNAVEKHLLGVHNGQE